MTNKSLSEWEQEHINILTSKQMGAWLGRRENRLLDEIRDEIEEQKKERCCDDNDMFVYRMGLDDALYIIDKYKAESEE